MVTHSRFRVLAMCVSFCMPVSASLASTLDPQAQVKARQIADQTLWQQPRSNNENRHPLGVQTLSIEALESKHRSAASVLTVYQYHYDLKQARKLTVDTGHAQLLKSQAVNSVHLPLNQTEINYATRLLQARAEIIEQLRNEQIKRGRTAFSSLSELDVKASIHEPLDASDPCYRQRCALLSLFDNTRTVFSAEPVVNLETQQIKRLGVP